MGFNRDFIIYTHIHKNMVKEYLYNNMAKENLKIALCGPSGSGKSTLARKISELTDIPYKENSAGLLLPPADQEYLVNQYGWSKAGHAEVIKLSHKNAGFAWEFQYRLLQARSKFMAETPTFIIDRSPVDNLTYFLLQTAIMVDNDKIQHFINSSLQAMRDVSHLIFIPTMLIGSVENNGSRIASYEYQRLVTACFQHVIKTYFKNYINRLLVLDTYDFDERVNLVKDFLDI